ncbi:phage tail-collar fiber domain-containing protein [Shewanella baltica]|uniref:Phage tail fibre protein N-terminal domain-containing protein n=1 Tax=Shewanella baltica (strain OS155 / ATCC BAA-1091) TaxID=325240 RepID=A3D257_SHEB5|nr:phage tail protein [Shewanella baltica]ABN60820.1 hypothetical protein Sbal_1302 [Shewanella baltica OS155]AEH13170.1 hypothetical protein Sbal117_1408 [Shewanella baltica OS117]
MAQVITLAGERLFALKAQNNQQLDIDTFIFAYVPGQDSTVDIDRNEGLPPIGQRVHTQIVQQYGMINENAVVYSSVLDSLTGPFQFNWVGLYSAVNQTLIAIQHIPTVSKTVTEPGASGNILNRNFVIEYSGIAELTGITVDPETWQLDYTARLNGMDELTRQLAADMNGKDWFIEDGFKVVPRSTLNTFKVTAGAGYVSGLRVTLAADHILTLSSYPQFVYVDAWFDGTSESVWKAQTAFTVTNTEMDDYIDVNGRNHYVFKLARITAADAVEDLRNVNGLAEKINKLDDDFYGSKYIPANDIRKYGAIAGGDHTNAILASLENNGSATLEKNTFPVSISLPIDVAEDNIIDLQGNELIILPNFVSNTDKTLFNHVGNRGKVLNVNCQNIGADTALIGYTNADFCYESGCKTGRGAKNLVRYQGVTNRNYSESLSILSSAKTEQEGNLRKYTTRVSASNNSLTFHRSRFFPSRCYISHIKVTDINGSPNFYFDLAMHKGNGFVFPFIRPAGTSNIDQPMSIDWFYDSFDDLFSFDIQNLKGTATEFEIEIFYTESKFGRDDIVWAYQSINDFNRPHFYGASTILEAVRSPEFRSHIVGGSDIDARIAKTNKSLVNNYHFPETTIPTPSGTQDITDTCELKFYFNFSAGMALLSGATHVRFRVYQQTRNIKCSVLNGFLSQVPDWASAPPHLAASYQPVIEVNISGASRDAPVEIIIPLDKKAMMNAVIEEANQDLKFFYLTFYKNAADHLPIVWGDVWEWDCEFLRV